MTKTILCAVDIGNPEQDIPVLQMAAKIARQEGAQLDIVTVVPDFGMSVVGGFFDKGHHEAALAEAKKRLDSLASVELGKDANAGVRHVVATGKAYEQILNTAKASESDLIVIGAHAPELSDYLLGPNAARVVRHATCSVYVVR